jgi:hypothetical protein
VTIEITRAGLGKRNLRFDMRNLRLKLIEPSPGSLSGVEDGAAEW